MNTAVIKRVLTDKGFGFLEVPGREKDLFFHANGVVAGLDFKSLKEGDKVVFSDIAKTGKGDAAIGVDLDM